MRNLKRVLTLVMAVAMMMSMLVVGAGAAFPDQDKINNTDAVNMNVALGIIKGRDTGVFDPTGNVTRAEMAKMITIVLNGGNEPSLGTKATPTFTDIKGHWAESYIEYCAGSGIVAGMGDGTFAPNANVTATQAAKMLLVALGYDAVFEGFNGASWSVKINIAANQKVLYDELGVFDPNAPLNRDNAAQMVWNALNAKEVKYEYSLTTVNGQLMNIQNREDKTDDLLKAKFKTTGDFEGIMVDYTWSTSDKKFVYTIMTNALNATGPGAYTDTTFKTETDYSHLFGLNVKIVYKDNSAKTVYGMYAEDSKVLATGLVNDLESTTTNKEIKFDGTKYTLDAGTNLNSMKVVAQNTWPSAATAPTATYGTAKAADSNLDAYEARLIDADNNGKVDYVVYLPFAYGEVGAVNSTSVTVKSLGGYAINPGKTSITLDRDDDKIYDGVAKDDYVVIIPAANTAYEGNQVTKMDSFDGTVNGTRTGEIYIDGTWYDDANSVGATKDSKYTFYAVGTFVYYADEISGSTPDKVVYLADTTNGDFGGVSAKLYFTDGTSKVVNVKEIKHNLPTAIGANVSYTKTSANYGALTTFRGAVDAGMGTIFTYSEKSGDYTLTMVNDTNKVGFKNFAGGTAGNVVAADGSKVGLLTITTGDNGNYSFADDAVVFVETQDGIDVITGAKAKDLKSNLSFTNASVLYNTTGSSVKTIRVASVFSNAAKLPSAQGVTGNYGYIIGAAYDGTFDDDDALVFDIFNAKTGNKETLYYTGTSLNKSDLAKGVTVKYDALGDGETDVITVLEAGVADVIVGAVKSSDEKTFVELRDGSYLYLTDDTQYIYADTSSVKLANCASSGNIVAADLVDVDDATKGYINNVLVFVDTDEVAFILVDTDNTYKAYNTAVTVGAAAADTQAKLTTLFNTYDTVTVTGAYDPAAEITVPAGKTLALNGTFTADDDAIVNGTLVLNSGATITGGTIAVAATGSVVISAGTVDNASLITGTANATITFKAGVIVTASASLYYADDANAVADAIGTPAADVSYTYTTFTETAGSTDVTGWLAD